MSTTERIDAGKHFGIQDWSRIRHAALRLAMLHRSVKPEFRDLPKIDKLCRRWKLGRAFAFYSERPDLFYTP